MLVLPVQLLLQQFRLVFALLLPTPFGSPGKALSQHTAASNMSLQRRLVRCSLPRPRSVLAVEVQHVSVAGARSNQSGK